MSPDVTNKSKHGRTQNLTYTVLANNSDEDKKQPLPEWHRLPKTGSQCKISGLSRSQLNELILGPYPRVESIALRKDGAKRGVRLIRTRSLMDFLDEESKRQRDQPSPPPDEKEEKLIGNFGQFGAVDGRAFPMEATAVSAKSNDASLSPGGTLEPPNAGLGYKDANGSKH